MLWIIFVPPFRAREAQAESTRASERARGHDHGATEKNLSMQQGSQQEESAAGCDEFWLVFRDWPF